MDRKDSGRVARALWPYVALWIVLAGTLTVLAAYEIGHSHQRAVAAARGELDRVARLASEHALQTLVSVDRTLNAVALIHARRLADAPLPALLASLHVDDDVERTISYFDRDGRFVASSSPALAKTVNIADRTYFADARDHPGDGMRIGTPRIGRISGRAVIPLVHRLSTADGAFDGVLVSAINPLRLVAMYRSIDVGATSTIGLVRRDGVIYARHAGTAAPDRGSIERLLAQVTPRSWEVASAAARGDAAGVPMLVSMQAIPGTSLLAFAAIEEAEALTEHHRYARSLISFAVVSLLGLSLPVAFVARRAVHDLHHRRDLEARYAIERRRARSDALTGVANRAAFDDQLERCNRALAEDGTPFVLAFIDIDRFKALNDTHGHVAGDMALRRVARTLTASVRSTDLVARFGGDEFAVLMLGATAESAPRVCGKLHAALLAAAAAADLGIGFSIGVVAFEQAPAAPRIVTALADRLMYEVKSAGGEGVRYGVYRRDGLHLEQEMAA